jgi:hypothetical protein
LCSWSHIVSRRVFVSRFDEAIDAGSPQNICLADTLQFRNYSEHLQAESRGSLRGLLKWRCRSPLWSGLRLHFWPTCGDAVPSASADAPYGLAATIKMMTSEMTNPPPSSIPSGLWASAEFLSCQLLQLCNHARNL